MVTADPTTADQFDKCGMYYMLVRSKSTGAFLHFYADGSIVLGVQVPQSHTWKQVSVHNLTELELICKTHSAW